VESKQEAKPDGAGVAEVVLTGGERLRIPCEEGTLSVVLRVLRALG
jgi:hypothetical protein